MTFRTANMLQLIWNASSLNVNLTNAYDADHGQATNGFGQKI